MADVFNFIFLGTKYIMEGEVCRNVSLGRPIVATLLAKLDLSDLSTTELIAECEVDLAEHLLLPDDKLTPEICLGACITVLALMMAIGKGQTVLDHAGIVAWFDREPDTSLDKAALPLRVQGADRQEIESIVAAMKVLGAEHRDLGVEARTQVAAQAAAQAARERKGATVH